MYSHSHCDNCFKFNCDYASSCTMIDCKQTGCEFRMHQCKQQEHLDIVCSRVRVPCINSEFGCNSSTLRGDIRKHLERCPASVVSCTFVNHQRLRGDTWSRCALEKFNDHFPQQQSTKDFSSLTFHMDEERPVEASKENDGEPNVFIPNHQPKPKQVCGSDFRRDEYCSHYRNVHCDIMHSLNGWMEKFCPNQQYGCTFNTRRIQPICNDRKTQIVFSKENKAFGHLVYNDDNESKHFTISDELNLTQLPLEVITLILSYLDSFSLNNISLTNKLLRSLCCNLLDRRGVVSLIWKREIAFNRCNWTVAGYRWKFSNHFSLIKKWKFDDKEFLNHFSNGCQHFDKLVHKEPFQLIGIGVKKEKNSLKIVNC